ncbi:hypothetical protein PG991_006387 [Apiospora marii]|uniref:Uncharacterized protein n=1 Tax=Apiospora marii TaxID=335849 RepID=A0ABR1SBW1_9PEZI
MGLADTIRETFGGAHPEHSSEASRGLVDHHTPGAFPADTPVAEEQRELGSQSNTTTAGSNVLAGKEGTVGRDDVLHGSTGSNKLSDVTHSHPQTVEKGALHGSSAASNTPTASGLSDVTRSRPETVGRDTVRNTAAGNTAPDSDLSDVTHSRPQTVEKGALQSHPQSTLNKDTTTGGSHFRRSSVSMPNDSTGTGPSESLASHNKNDTSTLGSLLGGNYYGGAKTDRSTYEKEHANEPASRGLLRSEDHNRAHQGTEGSTLGSGASSGTTLGAPGTDSSAQHNTVSNGRDKSSTDHSETYWGNLPSAQGVYNTITGSGSGEDHTSVHRHVPAAGDSEVAMQSAGHGPEARAPRGAGVYNTVVGHGSAADDTVPSENRSAEHQRTPSGGLYNTITSAAQGLYNTVSGRSGSGTEHQYEHDKPLTTTTSSTSGAGNTGLTGNNSRVERDTPSGTTSATSPTRSGNTTSDTTGNQGIAAGAYNAAASAAQGISNTVTGNNNNTNATGSQYEQNRPTTSAGPTGTRNTTTSSTEPGMAAGAYNAVANTAQSVADTVTGRNNTTSQYEQGGPYDDSTTSRSIHPSGSSTDNTTGTHRAFPLDNSSTFTTTNRSVGSDRNPTASSTSSHDHSHTGRNLAGAGAGAAAGAGVYDFLHRKEGDAPDPKNEFVSNVNPYNAPTHEHEGWQPSDSAGLFSDSELKRLSLRQKEMGDEELSPRSPAANLHTSGPGQTSSGSGVAYDTPQSLTAASSTGQRTRGDNYTGSSQTHGLGSGHPSAHKSEIPIPSRAHENLTPTSLDSQRADPPRSSDRSGHSNVEKGLAGAGLGAGAGYGASRLARDHHDDNKHGAGAGATSGIPAPTTTSRHHEPVDSSTLNRSAEPVSSTSHHHHHKDKKDTSPATTGSMLPLPSKHNDRHASDPTTDSGVSGQGDDKHQHKVRNVAAFGAAAGAGAAGYDMLSHGDSSPTGVRHPGQTAANTGSTSHPTMSSVATDRRTAHTPTASSSLNTATSPTTTTTSSHDDPQRSRAAAGMTSLNPTAGVAGFGVGAGGAGAAVASGMHQDGRPHHSDQQHQQREQEALSRSGDDGHAPLHSSADKHFKERGTAVPSANAGKKDPYNHLASGTPSGVSID